jgi:hypothetical protein
LLPDWVRSELEAQNSSHPFLREPTEAANPRSGKRRAPSTPASSPTAAASDRSAKKARKAKEKQVEEEEEEAVAPGDVEFPAVEAPAGKYANEWYSSPLDDKRFGKKKTDWDLVREALRVLPETAARAEADYHSLYAYARDNGELPEQLEDKEEEEEDNPFYGKYQ